MKKLIPLMLLAGCATTPKHGDAYCPEHATPAKLVETVDVRPDLRDLRGRFVSSPGRAEGAYWCATGHKFFAGPIVMLPTNGVHYVEVKTGEPWR